MEKGLTELIAELENIVGIEEAEQAKFMVSDPGYHIQAAKIGAYRNVIEIIKGICNHGYEEIDCPFCN